MSRAPLILLLGLALAIPTSQAGNGRQPCDRGAGGVSHCAGGKFVCNNGKVSGSSKVCTAADVPGGKGKGGKK